jgi:hypothetical protein
MAMEQTISSPSVASDEDSCDRLVELIVEQQETENQILELEHQIQNVENSLQDKT